MNEVHLLTTIAGALRDHLRRLRAQARTHGQAGYTTETVLLTALLVSIALAAGAILLSKVIAKANSVNLG